MELPLVDFVGVLEHCWILLGCELELWSSVLGLVSKELLIFLVVLHALIVDVCSWHIIEE